MPDTVDQDWCRLRAAQHGDKPMVIDPESRITYAELDDSHPRHGGRIHRSRRRQRAPGSV